MFVKPAPGRAVRDPEMNHALLPDEGRDVPRSEYFLRRLADADVIEAEPPAALPAAEPAGDPA